ncbi:MAG: hypothetical protein ABIH23_20855, partial [bacterium]
SGKRVIQWSNFVGLCLLLSLLVGIGVGVVYFLLSGQWKPFPFLYGLVTGGMVVGVGLIAGLRTPMEKLEDVG